MSVQGTKQLIGLPVVAIGSGEQLGKIREVLADAPAARVVGLLVESSGEEKDPQVVLTEDIQAVGKDAVTVADRSRLHPLLKQIELKALADQQMPIKGKAVLGDDGNRIGTVDEFTVDFQTFSIGEYLVLPGGPTGFLGTVQHIPAGAVVGCGPDALIIRQPQSQRDERSPAD